MTEPELLTLKEAAEVLRVSKSTAYELARTHRIPAVKIGAAWRVPRRTLLAHIEAQAEEAVRDG
jgi:excisionase family DNA binding protein